MRCSNDEIYITLQKSYFSKNPQTEAIDKRFLIFFSYHSQDGAPKKKNENPVFQRGLINLLTINFIYSHLDSFKINRCNSFSFIDICFSTNTKLISNTISQPRLNFSSSSLKLA